jgi:protoporphyrinogen oxidase
MDIVIGAGISGLSYAAFSEGRDCLVLESDRRIGGYCRTTRRNGFVWDFSGHFFHFRNPAIKDFVMDGIHPDLLLSVRKSARIRYKDRLVDYPFQKNIHQLDQEEFIDCLYDLFNCGGAYGTFREMLYAKFGKSISEKFLCPYNRKLYACDLDLLDKDAMGRFFPYADPLDVVRNFRRQENGAYNDTFIYSKEGAQSFVDSIASHIDPDRIRTGASVVSVDLDRHRVRLASGEMLPYDRLVSTLPLPRLLNMCGIPFDASIYSANQVLVFNLGFDSKGPDTADHWIYFPEEKYCFYRVGFYDNILGQDRTSLYVELGFPGGERIAPEVWLPRVLDDLETAGIIRREQELVDYEAIVMNPAYVHINRSSQEDVEARKKALRKEDVYSIGRYGSWTYCSIEDNIAEARALAEKLNGR